jgi:glycosyltransferase involved in cell wall biosynthesis
MKPVVSIILPVYNGAATIGRAIESVLAQDFSAWELLVIDDGSHDATVACVSKYTDPRISLVSNGENLGIQKTLNKGLALAQGNYIARIDSDDIWTMPQKLSLQVEYMEQNPQCVLVGTFARVVDIHGALLYTYRVPETDTAIRSRILLKNCFVHPSVVFRKDAAHAVGGYSESVETRHLEDWDLWMRLGEQGTFANIAAYAVELTLRPDSLSSQNKHTQFKRALGLVHAYKDVYPHVLQAYLLGFLRRVLFLGNSITPQFLRSLIIRIYKRFW